MKVNKNTPYYLSAFILFVVLKFAYTVSYLTHLNFLLKPTNQFVELLTGSQSVYLQDCGYFYKALNIVIDKSCSGFNFWLLCFLMLTFLTVKYFKKSTHKILAFIFSLVGSYLFTIIVNGSRIYTSIIVQSQDLSKFNLPPEILHESLGIITNLTFLVLIYIIVERVLNNKTIHAKFA